MAKENVEALQIDLFEIIQCMILENLPKRRVQT